MRRTPITHLPSVLRLLLAIGAAGAASAVWALLSSVSGGPLPTYTTCYPAVIAVSFVLGPASGLVTTGASTLIAWAGILPQAWSIQTVSTADVVGLVLFSGCGGLIAWLAARYHQMTRRTGTSEGSLEVPRRSATVRQSANRQWDLFEVTLASIADAVIVTDPRGLVTFLNPEATRLTGWKPPDAVGQSLQTVFPIVNEDTHQPMPDPVVLVIETAHPLTLTNHTLLRSRSGRAIPIDYSAAPVRKTDGVIHGVVIVFRDVTERRAAAVALAQRTAHLEALREIATELTRELNVDRLLTLLINRAVTLLDGVSGIVYLSDPTTRAIAPRAWVGHGEWIRSLRIQPGEGVAGRVIAEDRGIIDNAYRTSPDAIPIILSHTSHSAVLGEPLRYHERVLGAILVDRAAGSFSPEDAHLLRHFADHAAIVLQNARLYTEAQRAFEDLKRSQDELVRSEKLRSLGQMAAGIAHDLNNTLAAVLGQAELGRLQARDPEIQNIFTLIETAATDGATVVHRLQEFARPKGGERMEPCDLVPIIKSAIDLTEPRWKGEAERRGVTIEVVSDLERLPHVLGSPPEIREALINLIFNAVDAMPAGGRIVFTASANGETVTLRVADTGIGIPPEIQSRLFDPFFTTKGVRGSGLGLAGVYGTMDRLGGRVRVESTPGAGATFILEFPQAERASSLPVTSMDTLQLTPRRILVVDDEPIVRSTIATLFRVDGHTVVEAPDGPTALTVLAHQSIDIVYTDLGMPGMSGLALAEGIKTGFPGIPVILLTGWGPQNAGSPDERQWVDAVLGKPLRLLDLRRSLLDHAYSGTTSHPSTPTN